MHIPAPGARHYRYVSGSLLYHYCSPEVFLAICTKRSLRFSDIYSMNDSMEVRWGLNLLRDVIRGSQGSRAADDHKRVLERVDFAIRHLRPLVSCFSTQGDVLSQWRAYASDASGFCLGFDPRFLNVLPAKPIEVLYDVDKQRAEVSAAVDSMLAATDHLLGDLVVDVLLDLLGLKNPAFVEEAEVRLVHNAVLISEEEKPARLQSIGGFVDEDESEPHPIGFFMRGSLPVPFMDLGFAKEGRASPLREVILGPKNSATTAAITVFLETTGLSGVKVIESTASYR